MGPGVAVEAYGAFAYAYDKALGQRFFRAVQRLLDETLDRHPTPKRTHLDLACGTGLVLQAFRERGWRSTGVDASLAMLQVAQKRLPRVAAGDLRALPLRAKFARITCLYDSLNHMLDANDLAAAFHAVRGVMTHHGDGVYKSTDAGKTWKKLGLDATQHGEVINSNFAGDLGTADRHGKTPPRNRAA